METAFTGSGFSAAFMRGDVSDVGDPNLVGRVNAELLLQQVGRHHGSRSTSWAWPLTVATLRLQAFVSQQLGNPVPAAVLAQVTHVQGQLAIAINTTALEPCLLEQTQQPAVIKRPLAFCNPAGLRV